MKVCLEQAAMARNHCMPNPAVGAVLVDTQGHILGVGHTQRPGEAHAEIMALRDATARGYDPKGATICVSLEPCSHNGRTGPCTDALIQAGIGKVVASLKDPNPLVSGQGFEKLRAAGVEVEVGEGAVESQELNIGFFNRMVHKKPWVRMKMAASVDGKTALESGKSQWITSEAARADGHAWRARACALLTGIGTVLEDNPKLDVRLADAKVVRQPDLVVVDSRLQTPLTSAIFQAKRKVMIYTTQESNDKQKALEAQGAMVIRIPGDLGGKVDLRLMLEDLGKREINELHVEAGYKLNGSLLKEALVDELLIYLAPLMIGQGLPMASFGPIDQLSQALKLKFISSQFIGADLRVIARFHTSGDPIENIQLTPLL